MKAFGIKRYGKKVALQAAVPSESYLAGRKSRARKDEASKDSEENKS